MGVESRRVLVVDDSATMRRMVKLTLSGLANAEFVDAGNGLEAIEQLSLTKFDLVILDLNMPDMHGLEVVKFLRKHAAFKKIPIIVLTTRSDDAGRESVLAAGASLYMNKPFEPAKLMEHARHFLDVQ
ncbi:MAG: two-component system response regulator [Pirellula sp.]|nr:two-component system response regulator [Pirellula sp.]